MKSIWGFVFAISVLGFSQAQAQYYYQEDGQNQQDQYSDSGLVGYFERLRPFSLRILQEAIARTNNDLYKQMYDILKSARIEEGPQNAEDCNGDTEAYVFPGTNIIYVCHESSEGYNIRTLLHETAHLAGYDNECDADYYSGMAEIDSGEGLTGSGGYDDECSNNPRN